MVARMNVKGSIYRLNIFFLLFFEIIIIFGVFQAILYKDELKFTIESPCVENKIENIITFDRLFFSISLNRQEQSKDIEQKVTFSGVYLKYFDTLLLIGRLNCTPMFVRLEITERSHHINSSGTGCVYLSSQA